MYILYSLLLPCFSCTDWLVLHLRLWKLAVVELLGPQYLLGDNKSCVVQAGRKLFVSSFGVCRWVLLRSWNEKPKFMFSLPLQHADVLAGWALALTMSLAALGKGWKGDIITREACFHTPSLIKRVDWKPKHPYGILAPKVNALEEIQQHKTDS